MNEINRLQIIDQILNEFRQRNGVPAVGASIVDSDGEAISHVVGTRRRDSPDEAVASDRWHIGSCTKSITAALWARLVELGFAEWRTSLPEIFGDLRPGDARWAEVRVGQLYVLRPLGVATAGFGAPEEICGHRPRVTLRGVGALRGPPASLDDPKNDNPPVYSSAGCVHLTLDDWSALMRIFLADNSTGLLHEDSLRRIFRPPARSGQSMVMGWMQPIPIMGVPYSSLNNTSHINYEQDDPQLPLTPQNRAGPTNEPNPSNGPTKPPTTPTPTATPLTRVTTSSISDLPSATSGQEA